MSWAVRGNPIKICSLRGEAFEWPECCVSACNWAPPHRILQSESFHTSTLPRGFPVPVLLRSQSRFWRHWDESSWFRECCELWSSVHWIIAICLDLPEIGGQERGYWGVQLENWWFWASLSWPTDIHYWIIITIHMQSIGYSLSGWNRRPFSFSVLQILLTTKALQPLHEMKIVIHIFGTIFSFVQGACCVLFGYNWCYCTCKIECWVVIACLPISERWQRWTKMMRK